MENLVQFPAVARRESLERSHRVPTFDADGARIRDYSEARVADLVALGRMAAVPNRHGKILFAQLLRRDAPTWRPASHAKYKPGFFDPELPGRAACAALFGLPDDRMTRRKLSAYQRAIYQQVLLSVMQPLDSPHCRDAATPKRLAA